MHIGKKIALLRNALRLTQEELASKAKIESRGKLAMWEAEKVKNLPLEGIAKVASALSLTADDLVNKNIDQLIAQVTGEALSPGPTITGMVPLISWVAAGHWTGTQDIDYEPETWLPSPKKNSTGIFALRVSGISMEPKFQDGDIVFVDPDAAQDDGKIVVAVTPAAGATMKQLVHADGKPYLKPLNPDWPGDKFIKVEDDVYIVGVVIGKWVEC